ncbi:MAG TPA: RluA family pseudouridine synthase [Kiritimatiellia bacterium]|nr:RluA family pseudouridine synthase [Kiritimatiellia bacterium]
MPRMPALPPILLEDEHLVAFDKPSGLLIAPDRWDKARENLMALVHARLAPTIFNAHRLDRDTSGVVLCAKTKPALDALCIQFERGEVEKEYVALVRGRPPAATGEINEPIAPDPNRPGRVKTLRSGKAALTCYEIEQPFRSVTLLRLRPRTGRTHQLRIHLKHLGCPIVADPWYGDGRPLLLSEIKRGYKPARGEERPILGRLALHAHRLTFTHPATGARVAVEAPLPDDLQLALKQLVRWSA